MGERDQRERKTEVVATQADPSCDNPGASPKPGSRAA